MQHFSSLDDVQFPDSWLTIGSFDGVHLGHQEIVRKVTGGAHAEGLPAVVLTFSPPPAVVLQKRSNPAYLTLPDERAELLGQLGVDVVITHLFTLELAHTGAAEFTSWVHQHLHFSHLCVGYDFALGRGRQGDVAFLKQYGEQLGYTMNIQQPISNGDQVISSSQIRRALAEGEAGQARRLLGRPYRLSGDVVHGDGRGRTIGIPTANLALPAERVVPKSGVYTCLAQIEGVSWPAVTNVGVRPTFDNQSILPQVETHLLDYNRDLYGRHIDLDFIERLRDEQRFPNVNALVEQIHADIALARQHLQTVDIA